VLAGSRGDPVEVGDLSGRHLHGAERDDVDVLSDRAGELGGGNEADGDAASLLHEEGKEERGELDIGDEHSRTVRDGSCDRPDERRDVRADSDRLEGDADEPGIRRASILARDPPMLPARPPPAPVPERVGKRLPRGRGRQAVGGGVQVRPGGPPERLSLLECERLHQGSLTTRR
jgi:hypothetical protein